MYEFVVNRFEENNKQTLSRFVIYNDCKKVFEGNILELPYNNNKRSISRINAGIYNCVKRYSAKYGNHFHVLDVLDRDYILIHVGNYYTDTRGCLLPGRNLTDINRDGFRDVTSSGPTMIKLNKILPKEFQLTIINNFE